MGYYLKNDNVQREKLCCDLWIKMWGDVSIFFCVTLPIVCVFSLFMMHIFLVPANKLTAIWQK